MYYAMKANNERTMLDTISQYVAGFEGFASQGEMAKGLVFKQQIILFLGGLVGKTRN